MAVVEVSIAYLQQRPIKGEKVSSSKKYRYVFFVILTIAGIVSLVSCSWKNRDASGSPPTVYTIPASSILNDRAVLNGTVSPAGSAVNAWFEYGTDPALSTWITTTRQVKKSVATPLPFKASILGLNSYTTYYYRAAASNRFGTQRGDIQTFPTGEYYVAVGDSITRAGGKRGFAPTLSELLKNSKGYPNTIANRGVDGATSAEGAKLINFTLSTLPMAKYYLVMYGTNDARLGVYVQSGKGLRPGEPGYNGTYKDNLQNILSAILAAGKIPCIAKVPHTSWWNIDIMSIQDYNVVIDELVVANSIAVTPPDFYTYFQKHPDELADGLHPNKIGYESMANLWFQALTR